MLDLPDHLRDRMIATHSDTARSWLEALPANVERLQRDWGFTLGRPFLNLSYAYVAEATLAGGARAVLKAQPPHMESRSEVVALRAWDGRGAVQLLEADVEAGFVLLERLEPGAMADDINEDAATRALAEVMPALWITPPADPALIALERWAKELFEYPALFGADGPLPLSIVEEAAAVYREMLATSPQPRLLHGDLHHGNILSATRAPWLAIDPKGVVGDPAFEPSAMFFNPQQRLAAERDIPGLVSRRLAIICDSTGLDRQRVASWGFARTMLSLCWSATSGSPVEEPTLAVAMALRD